LLTPASLAAALSSRCCSVFSQPKSKLLARPRSEKTSTHLIIGLVMTSRDLLRLERAWKNSLAKFSRKI
jgi:hypothetical protein